MTAKLLSNRDGGKLDEKGLYYFLDKIFPGEVVMGMSVTQQGTPAMGITVGTGTALIPTGNGYPYLAFTDATNNVTINTADGSNPRIDLIVAYIDLTVVSSASPNNPNALLLTKVTGTPSGSPAVPNTAAIQAVIGASNPYIILARVAVAAGATTITNSNITDVRSMAAANNPFRFRAYRATNYTSATAAFGKVPIDTVTIDSGPNFDTTNNRFVAQVAGDYFFYGNTLTAATTTNRYIAALYKNGSAAAYGIDTTGSGGGTFIGVSVSDTIRLAVGDYVEFYLFASAATSMGGDAGLSTRFGGHLITRV